MKIVFVYPDYESLGVEYLMAVCMKDGHDVDFVFYKAEDTYLGKDGRDIPFREIAGRISDASPHVVAFSCVTDNYQFQLRCAKALKDIRPDLLTVFGGVHPSAVPQRVLRNPQVDCVAIGEAEKSFPEFLRAGKIDGTFILPDGPVKGMVFKKEGSQIGEFSEGELSDLDALPFPYKARVYSELPHGPYEYRVMTSRGCPYRCSYCFNSYFANLRGKFLYRQRSVDNVIAEVLQAKNDFPVKYISFIDDSFITNSEWVFKFCEVYKYKVGVPFGCIANPAYINEAKVKALSEAGCVMVQIGIQSLSETLCRDVLLRKSDNRKIAEVIDLLKKYRILAQVDHMLGISGDTLENQEEGMLFYNRHRPDIISIFWLTYYPRTAIIEIAKKQGVLNDEDIENIEEGIRLTKESYLTGGSMNDPKPFYGVSLMLNYLPVLPAFLVSFLLRMKIHRILRIRSFFISTALPRIITSVFNPKDFKGRGHIIRFFDKYVSFKRGHSKARG